MHFTFTCFLSCSLSLFPPSPSLSLFLQLCVRIEKNPGLGFSISGGISGQGNPFKPSDMVRPDPACQPIASLPRLYLRVAMGTAACYCSVFFCLSVCLSVCRAAADLANLERVIFYYRRLERPRFYQSLLTWRRDRWNLSKLNLLKSPLASLNTAKSLREFGKVYYLDGWFPECMIVSSKLTIFQFWEVDFSLCCHDRVRFNKIRQTLLAFLLLRLILSVSACIVGACWGCRSPRPPAHGPLSQKHAAIVSPKERGCSRRSVSYFRGGGFSSRTQWAILDVQHFDLGRDRKYGGFYWLLFRCRVADETASLKIERPQEELFKQPSSVQPMWQMMNSFKSGAWSDNVESVNSSFNLSFM